jgi:hypothetical protein
MRSKWLDWPHVIGKCSDLEPSKPAKLSFDGFVGPPPGRFPIICGSELPVSDPHAERMQMALREIIPSHYPTGMIPWLGRAFPEEYDELTGLLPDEIHRLWSERAPLKQFEAALDRIVALHQRCCEMYRAEPKS